MPLASPKYPFRIWAVQGAPDDPGLYALYDNEEMICIGIALGRGGLDTIRHRLLEHFHARQARRVATHYQWEISSNPIQKRLEYLRQVGKVALRCEEVYREAP